ncbi:MAG: hypothetical protein M3N54_06605 [Acidobacteriota bacterium]|nr:hypothetical protein [Acidobacteriota bacterium]
MRPLTTQEKQLIIESQPQAAPGALETDIQEYERLVAGMFQTDPDALPDAGPVLGVVAEPDPARHRLAELHARLFGGRIPARI